MGDARLIRSLAAVEVRVPDPDATAAFLADALDLFPCGNGNGGLDLTTEGDYGVASPERVVTVRPGDALELGAIVFRVGDAAALDAVATRVGEQAVEVERVDGKLAFVDPHGIRVECRLPGEGAEPAVPHSAVRPRRLGHVNVKVADPPAAAAFYSATLGLALTEQLGDRLFFLRVGSDHHNLAFRPSNGNTNVHHVALEAEGWDQIRVICDHMAARGLRIEYGPGRHAPGHQLFIYLTDPSSGLRVEAFADMAHIADDSFTPIRREIDRMRSVNVWGPEPPPSFLE